MPECRSAGVPKCRSAGVPECRSAGVPDSVQAMKSGAVEFLVKPVDDATLLSAVRLALDGDRIARSMRFQLDDIKRRLATLTPREAQVLDCVTAGKLNKQTAAELGTTEKTIKVHRARDGENEGAVARRAYRTRRP